MGIFCLGTYLRVLLNAKNKTSTQKALVSSVLSLFLDFCDDSDTAISKLVYGINNPTKELIEAASAVSSEDFEKYTSAFSKKVLPLINPNKTSEAIRILSVIIAEDEEINNDTVVDILSGIRKSDLTGKIDNPSAFLMGLFVYSVRHTDNRHEKGFIENTVNEYTKIAVNYVFENKQIESEPESNSNIHKQEIDIYRERAEQKAISFCQKYDSEKELIPLCQIIAVTTPTKKHSRDMFNEYCLCEKSAKEIILETNEIAIIDINDNDWWEDCLDKLCKDYQKYNLGDDRFLYLFKQYFHRLINYSEEPISEYLDLTFPRTVINPILFWRSDLNIIDLIDEYIYYKDYAEYKNKLVPPMNLLWEKMELANCEERRLAIILALFIIGVCCSIPCQRDTTVRIPSLYSIKTAEDLFYTTLLHLYKRYQNNDMDES